MTASAGHFLLPVGLPKGRMQFAPTVRRKGDGIAFAGRPPDEERWTLLISADEGIEP